MSSNVSRIVFKARLKISARVRPKHDKNLFRSHIAFIDINSTNIGGNAKLLRGSNHGHMSPTYKPSVTTLVMHACVDPWGTTLVYWTLRPLEFHYFSSNRNLGNIVNVTSMLVPSRIFMRGFVMILLDGQNASMVKFL